MQGMNCRMRILFASFAMIVAVFSYQASSIAQTVTGSIVGTIRDQQGGVIQGAAVTAKNSSTGAVRTGETDSTGGFRIVGIPAGPYEVTATASGFQTAVHSNVTLTVGGSQRVDFTLSVGAVEQQVEVTSELPQVDTTTSTMSGVVGETAVRELPLNGRDWLQLAELQPGATFFRGQSQNDVARLPRGNGQAISISGGRPTENVYRLDGLVINDFANQSPGSALFVNMGVDAVREFSVLTNTFSAEYGRSSGGVINAITKSGTNSLHGTVFYFMRNSALDARNFFDIANAPNASSAPPFRRHQFGASLGGPIKKDKTFFFANYEGLREFKSLSFSSNTLSPNARDGNLVAGPVNIDPRIKLYLPLYPTPNGAISGDTAKYNFGGGRDGTENFVIGRMDHMFSSSTMLNGTYRLDRSQVFTPDVFNEKDTSAQTHSQIFLISLQHIFSPRVLNNVRGGVTRTWATDGFDINPRNPLLTDLSLSFLPGIPAGDFNLGSALNSFGGIGATGADVVGYTAPQLYDDLSWTKGRHSVRVGFALERIDDNVNPQTTPNGSWSFGSIKDMLTANPSQFTTAIPPTDTRRGFRSTITAGYVQDDFRFRPSLTVNLGLRYETATSIKEVNGKIGGLVNITDASSTKMSELFKNPTLRNFEPRIGLAWDPFGDGKTSVRAGFGVYDSLPLPYLFWNKGTHGVPFFRIGIVSAPGSGTNPLIAAFPNQGLSLLQDGTLRVLYLDGNPRRPYKMQWNFNVQRELARSLTVMVGYVGASSSHLPVGQNDADMVPLALTTRAPDGHYLFPATGTIQRINPNFGRIDATLFNGHASYHALQTNLKKLFSRGMTLQATYSWSKSLDNGSTTFSQNETLNSSDNGYIFDQRLNRGVSVFDVPQNLAVNLVWEVPVVASLKGVARSALAGWQIGGIFTAQSGAPFSVGLQGDQARTGSSTTNAAGGQRPDFNAIAGCTPNAVTGDPGNYIKKECFSFPASGTLGNLGRNTLRGPSLKEFDFSLVRNQALKGEKLNMQFRAEIFNLLNHANLQAQTTTLFNRSGVVIPTALQLGPPTVTSSRQIQFGLKLTF
jgi:carboxypeptidase family protein/TonB-dependent receptor-like protein